MNSFVLSAPLCALYRSLTVVSSLQMSRGLYISSIQRLSCVGFFCVGLYFFFHLFLFLCLFYIIICRMHLRLQHFCCCYSVVPFWWLCWACRWMCSPNYAQIKALVLLKSTAVANELLRMCSLFHANRWFFYKKCERNWTGSNGNNERSWMLIHI